MAQIEFYPELKQRLEAVLAAGKYTATRTAQGATTLVFHLARPSTGSGVSPGLSSTKVFWSARRGGYSWSVPKIASADVPFETTTLQPLTPLCTLLVIDPNMR